ncbi:MAG TPA: hypothetical protein P5052_01570 [Candidatus Paceibacterota bacterium]|jgi:hypothetical protein|nr:hypothetical protein [Candidatus Paceibacterota bacterium]HRZ29452.1 hypothetical protein [Candidatus Paceibacterota bacterium]
MSSVLLPILTLQLVVSISPFESITFKLTVLAPELVKEISKVF